MSTVFESAQAYVILGRVQNPSQLYFLSFPELDSRNRKIIRCDPKAKEMAHLTELRSLTINATEPWFLKDALLKIACFNASSIRKHFEDICADYTLLRADVLCVTETWLHEDENVSRYHLDNYSDMLTLSHGKGKGILIAGKELTKLWYLKNDDIQIICFNVQIFQVIVIYRSKTCLLSDLKKILDSNNLNSNCIIVGNFNFHYSDSDTNCLTKYLKERGFTQVVKKPTHRLGNTIDQLYYRFNVQVLTSLMFHPLYYSDHEALCYTIIQDNSS